MQSTGKKKETVTDERVRERTAPPRRGLLAPEGLMTMETLGMQVVGEDNRYRNCWRRSRSRDCGSDRRRRRRRSRSGSGGGYGQQHVKRCRSKENPRLYGSGGRHAQGDKDNQSLRHTDLTMEEDNAEEDIEKQLETIRLRRQEILKKHKKQEEQSEQPKLNIGLVAYMMENCVGVGDGASDDTKLSLDEPNASVVSGYAFVSGKDRGGLGEEGTPKSEDGANPNNDFIFGESPPPAGGQKLEVKRDGLASEMSGLSDNWDDADGYYCHRIGEVLGGRYEVAASHGRGVFSSVVRARALKPYTKKDGQLEEVAIKIIRNNDVMLKCGRQELNILKKLDGADPDNRRHCVRFLTSFGYRNHLCLVFESMHMNLREVLKKVGGRKTGLHFEAVRAYVKQLFIALKHLRNCGVLHCDIKPDNMLVNGAKNVLKLCDFGSAMFAGENEITPYLVSRFYRAPEIILGLPYDHPLDMWSVGCCLYEFFTGKVLFPGPTNNDMLRLHMELKGPFPKKILKKACFVSEHFDQDYNFCAVEKDPVTKVSIKRVSVNVKPKGIASLVTGRGTLDENAKMLEDFKDLLDKILMLDPGKRLTVPQALDHPFITGK